MSYNVKSFNDKGWIIEEDLDKKIIGLINEKQPDIVCIQEHNKKYKLGKDQYPFQYEKLTNQKFEFGHIIYSKYPILNSGSFNFEKSGNNILWADIAIKGDTVRVYNAHLQSFKVPADFDKAQANSERFLRRVRSAVIKQEQQVKEFVQHEKESPYPVLVAGDLNNTAFSYSYRQVKGDKQDAFAKAGKGIGYTFLFDWYPVRIDFILADPKLIVSDFETYTMKYSDHYPIMSTISWD